MHGMVFPYVCITLRIRCWPSTGAFPVPAVPLPGKMSSDRALRKQQQLNNLVYMVTTQAKPGDRIVDFCSGGVLHSSLFSLAFPRRSDLLLYTKGHVYMTRLLSQNKQSLRDQINLFLFLPFSGHVGIVLAHMLPSCQVRSGMIDDRKLHNSISWVWLIPLLSW